MTIVLRRPRFAPTPWPHDHPRRRELGRRLDPDHVARRINHAVDRLDLADLHHDYQGVGSQAYRPGLLLKAVLYEVRQGRHSPAQWYRDARESGPVRWLLRGSEPSRSCWYAFRDRIVSYLEDWNRQVLAIAVEEGLTTARRGALDGTLIAANASRRRLLDEAKLRERCAALDRATDSTAVRPRWLAPTAEGQRRQREQLRRAQGRLEELQRRNAGKRASKRVTQQRVVVSPSDPEAALGRDKEGVYRPLYNVQVVDDLDSPFVLAYGVFAQPNDAGLLGPMTQRLKEIFGCPVAVLLADSAYAGGADLAVAVEQGVTLYAPPPADGACPEKQIPKRDFVWLASEETYRCPQGHHLEYVGSCRQRRSGTEAVQLAQYRCPPEHCRECPLRARCTPRPEQGRTISRSEHEEFIEGLRARMNEGQAKELYGQRRQTVELVNADWKEHRKLRRMSGRGLTRAGCQVGVTVLAQNLLTLLAQENKKAEKSSATKPEEIAA